MANDFSLFSREPVYAALFAKIAAASGFVTTSRRLLHWADVDPSMQPAMFMAQGSQLCDLQPRGLPSVWHLQAKVYVYAQTQDTDNPGTIINPILDAIATALQPNAIENAQTLGGLVTWCRIEGTIETDEGTLGNQLVAIIPINMLIS